MEITNEQYLVLLGQKEVQIFRLQIALQEAQQQIQVLSDKNNVKSEKTDGS